MKKILTISNETIKQLYDFLSYKSVSISGYIYVLEGNVIFLNKTTVVKIKNVYWEDSNGNIVPYFENSKVAIASFDIFTLHKKIKGDKITLVNDNQLFYIVGDDPKRHYTFYHKLGIKHQRNTNVVLHNLNTDWEILTHNHQNFIAYICKNHNLIDD